jgi:uridine phosphorylase
MQTDVVPGHIVIATGAIRAEGTSKEYLPVEFPAVADPMLTRALSDSASDLNTPHHIGVVQCKDSFYGQHCPERQPVSYELTARWSAWISGGCLASEMESAALFIVASCLKARAGTVLLVAGNQERRKAGIIDEYRHDTTPAIRVAIGALRRTIAIDRANQL